MNNILSLDFDYFYPDSLHYDWGLNENFSPELSRVMWAFRECSIELIEGNDRKNIALYKYVAEPIKISEFFTNINFSDNVSVLVTDSHMDIVDVVKQKSRIYNFDQHHDFYNASSTLNCGNWVAHLVLDKKLDIEDYHVIYPAWRQKYHDAKMHMIKYANVHYSVPDLPTFDQIFVCQSTAFTPPWDDKCFHLLIDRMIERLSNFVNR